MRANRHLKERGAALLITLVLVSAIALIVVSLYTISKNEAQVSGSRMADTRSHLAERAAFEDAKNLLLTLTANDDYLVTSVMHQFPGDPTDSTGTRYTFITTPAANALTHTPLFAGGDEEATSLPDFNATETAILADGPIAAPSVNIPSAEPTEAIETYGLVHLSPDGEMIPENRYPRTVFQEITPGPKDKFLQRYTWWIEDLEGYPNIDVVGGWTDHHEDPGGRLALDFIRLGYDYYDPRTSLDAEPQGARIPLPEAAQFAWQFPKSFRGQTFVGQVAPGLSPREIILQPWATDSIGIYDHPFARAHDLISARHWLSPGGSYTRSTAERKENRFILGLRPYLTVPKIPFGHGYADEGERRFPLNKLVAERDMELAAIITRNLPAFDTRKGGFPDDENYIATIAANAIDYADQDFLPTLPSNANNAGTVKFRGVDAYCPVNEFFVRFEYTGYHDKGEAWEIEFKADLFAEFWNTSIREVQQTGLKLDFEILDGLQFKAETRLHDIDSDSLVLNEPLDVGFDLNMYPNALSVVPLGSMKWKVDVPKQGSPSAFPIVSGIKGKVNSSARANYNLLLAGTKIDSRGRTLGADGENATAAKHGFFFQAHNKLVNPGDHFMRVATGNRRLKGYGAISSDKGSHLGDPWMDYYSQSTLDNAGYQGSEYKKHASPGLRNLSNAAVASRPPGEGDLYADQIRVRDWPDRGYENALNEKAPEDYDDQLGITPSDDDELPTAFGIGAHPTRAPWRLSHQGRFFSVTELGNLHDPVMWVAGPPGALKSIKNQHYNENRDTYLKSLPRDATPSPLWGGGNTLRIGRPEHELFDQPGMRASQLLDLFHVGYNGSNLLAENGNDPELYANYDPRDHQPPPTALDPVDSVTQPYSLVHDPKLHAQSEFDRILGHLNINAVPTIFEIETMLRGALVSNGLLMEQDSEITPIYTDEVEIGSLVKTLNSEAIPLIAADLYKARPFYSPSHLARVLSELLDRHDALPEHHNDAEAEETFARILNTTTFSSRHFRIFTYAETVQPETQQVFARQHRVYEVFVEPVRDDAGEIKRCRMQILSSRDL